MVLSVLESKNNKTNNKNKNYRLMAAVVEGQVVYPSNRR